MNTVDRRVRRTKKALGDALIELAMEKGYEAITIQEITDRADIGYRTFFRHYADKDGLFKEISSDLIMGLSELALMPPPEVFANPAIRGEDYPDQAVLFHYVQEHADLFRILLHNQRIFAEAVMDFAIQRVEDSLAGVAQSDIPIEIIAHYNISATFAMVAWWLDADMPYSPEQMGQYWFRLVMLPTRDTILRSAARPE